MAGYPGQRPYGGGPPAPRPGPGSAPHRGQYDNYQQDAYGYDYYDDGGYGPEYGGQYQDPNYARGPPPPNQGYPPQDYYAGGPGTNGPREEDDRLKWEGAVPYPVRRRPMALAAHTRPGADQEVEEASPWAEEVALPRPLSPPGPQGFGGAFPAFPGQGRKTDLDAEAAILNKMAGMDITGSQRPSGPPNGRVPPPRDPRRGPDPGYGPDLRGDGYGPPGPRETTSVLLLGA
ncbi:SKT5 protein [Colletotrichum higginsianum]|nr:SKT5 protein [Colletotrichum higginsianum]